MNLFCDRCGTGFDTKTGTERGFICPDCKLAHENHTQVWTFVDAIFSKFKNARKRMSDTSIFDEEIDWLMTQISELAPKDQALIRKHFKRDREGILARIKDQEDTITVATNRIAALKAQL